MIDQVQQKRVAPRVSLLGILIACLVFWAAFAALIVNW